MTTCEYDAAFVACREPDVNTGEFARHHYRSLEAAYVLLLGGVVKYLLLSGGSAKWYRDAGITPWFGTEADASANYLTKELGCPPEVILKDTVSENSVANFLCSAEGIIDPMNDPNHPRHRDYPEGPIESLVVVGPEGRLRRQSFLADKVLPDEIKRLGFMSVGPTNDPWLDEKERFALAMQSEYLIVPDGRAGWQELKSTAYEGALLLPFWSRFDTAQQAMPPASEGAILNISEIVANMDSHGLRPDLMEFAATAAGNLALAGRQG